jgi:hypothetical protein
MTTNLTTMFLNGLHAAQQKNQIKKKKKKSEQVEIGSNFFNLLSYFKKK